MSDDQSGKREMIFYHRRHNELVEVDYVRDEIGRVETFSVGMHKSFEDKFPRVIFNNEPPYVFRVEGCELLGEL